MPGFPENIGWRAGFGCPALYSSGLGAYTSEGLLRYQLRSGNSFLLIKDEVTDTLYIYVWPFGPFFWFTLNY